MSKEDIPPAPDDIPGKRAALKKVHDQWIATWLAREDTSPSTRKRLEAEKLRRKRGLPPVHLGFTGTQSGMTPKQKAFVGGWLDAAADNMERGQEVVAHHGMCVGADEQFHRMCINRGIPIVMHPGDDPNKRGICVGEAEILPSKDNLERNKDIVRASTMMIATPKEMTEKRRSGTWMTIRYARDRGTTITVVLSNGLPLIEEEDGSKMGGSVRAGRS
jgi:hypothetical protein